MLFTMVSGNKKLGPIPMSISSQKTCPNSCSLKSIGCYAKHGQLLIHWRKANLKESYKEFIKKISELPKRTFWRHNVAGDLLGRDNKIDIKSLKELVKANSGKKGFTYTHYPLKTKSERLAITEANKNGFTINLSADNISHADKLVKLNIAPVTTIVKSNITKNFITPHGNKVVICPAVIKKNITCNICRMCYNVNRKTIIGFPAHGNSKRIIDKTME